MNLAGKNVLVTGGTSGIGLALSRSLRDRGARVWVIGRDQQAVSALARREGFTGIAADLSSSVGCQVALEVLAQTPLDILVNNAGVDPHYNIDETVDLDAIDRAIYLNLAAPIRLITGLIAALRARPSAAIVNVTSGYAVAPSASTPVYCATKAGLRSFTLALRYQLRGTNVAVIEALPPLVDTPMTSATVASSKMSPERCAAAIVDAILKDRKEANIGQVRLLRVIESVSPTLARRVMIAS